MYPKKEVAPKARSEYSERLPLWPHPIESQPNSSPGHELSPYCVTLSQIPEGVEVAELTHCIPPVGLRAITMTARGEALVQYQNRNDAEFAVRYFELCHLIQETSLALLRMPIEATLVGEGESSNWLSKPNHLEHFPPSRLLHYSKVLRLCDQFQQGVVVEALGGGAPLVDHSSITSSAWRPFLRDEEIRTLFVRPLRDLEKGQECYDHVANESYFSQFRGFQQFTHYNRSCFVRFVNRQHAEDCLLDLLSSDELRSCMTVSFANKNSKDTTKNEDNRGVSE